MRLFANLDSFTMPSLLQYMSTSSNQLQGSVMGALKTDTVLILFVQIVIVIIYLMSLLLVVVRRAKRLMQLHNRKYYIVVIFYIASKLVLSAVLIVQVIVGMAKNWDNIEPQKVELIIKTAIVLADFSIIQLFLVALETYLSHCLSASSDCFSRRRSRLLSNGLKALQLGVALVLLIPMIVFVFDADVLGYQVVNSVDMGLNLLTIISFLVTFFYLNFKMTGIMMDSQLNGVIKRIYKVQLIILISRTVSLCFQIVLSIYVLPRTFQQQIDQQVAKGVPHEVMLGLVFVGSVIFVLITEGLPIMYSLRSTVVHALNHKSQFLSQKQGMFTDNTSAIEESLMQREGIQQNGTVPSMDSLRLKNFKNLVDVSDKDDSLWISKKGTIKGKLFLVRISKRQISPYIFEQIQNEVNLWNELNLKCLSQLNYFCQGQIIHLVEKYYVTKLDDRVDQISSQVQCLRLTLKLAESIQQLHDFDIIHGCLSPNHIFVEEGAVILNGLGLHSLKKYLSLISGYTNKTLYTAVQHLRGKSSIIIKPNKHADIYSFGIILFQMVSLNRQYRQLPLRDVQLKFVEQNFRPKLPDNLKTQVKALIRRCWNETPERRPAIEEVIDILRKLT